MFKNQIIVDILSKSRKGNDFKDSAKQMQDAGTDALLRTLALATTAGN